MLFRQLLAIGVSFTLVTGLIHPPVEAQPQERSRAIIRVIHTPLPAIPHWVGWVIGGILLSAAKNGRRNIDDW